jgi:transposase
MILRLDDGTIYHIRFTLHRHHSRGGVYRRVSDWLAHADRTSAWGRTQREAMAHLAEMTGGTIRRKQK